MTGRQRGYRNPRGAKGKALASALKRKPKKKRRKKRPKKWIQAAIKRPGQLHRDLGVPAGKKIPAKKLAAAAKRKGKVGQRARLAQTLRRL